MYPLVFFNILLNFVQTNWIRFYHTLHTYHTIVDRHSDAMLAVNVLNKKNDFAYLPEAA